MLNDFPCSQHRPIIYKIGIHIPVLQSIPKPRWNFKKADWESYGKYSDANIRWIDPVPENYERFCGLIKSAAKKSIPRGFRKEYIPGWNEEASRLAAEFEENSSQETAKELLKSLDHARKEKWMNIVEGMNFTHSSRKAWSLIRKLNSSSMPQKHHTPINVESIANHLVSTSKTIVNKKFSKQIKAKLHQTKRDTQRHALYSQPFTISEVEEALNNVRCGKAAGLDGIYPELLKYCGPATKRWLASFFSCILESGRLPPNFKKTKIIALLKPGKDPNLPESYRPIALLSVTYKLLERLILNRITPAIETLIPNEQAGFRPKRDCSDQVLSLTTYVENGFEMKKKSVSVFLDLSAAYDTVWREGMLIKLIKAIPCIKVVTLIDKMLKNRLFQVFSNHTKSKFHKLNNGLPQGSVLAPILFNLYTHDLPETVSQKFIYADDICLIAQQPNFTEAEDILNKDLHALDEYFRMWRLKPNPQKTEVATFHLSNKYANYHPRIIFRDHILQYNSTPKYLGVTLDRSLTYRHHLQKTAAKLKSRNNLLQQLTGTSWGADANTLRTTALALVYSPAEYCSGIWLHSSHTSLVDVQLRQTMRIVSGTLLPTPVQWLPVLSNIIPPHIRRQKALAQLWTRIQNNEAHPIHNIIQQCTTSRLKSRQPAWRTAINLPSTSFDPKASWKEEWTSTPQQGFLWIYDPTLKPAGFNLPRATWCKLNRIRCGTGRTADALYKWGWQESSRCDCNDVVQTVQHVVQDCPVRAFPGSLEELHEVSPEAVVWLDNLDISL